MRRYFTWRCIGLHALLVVLVPLFLLAGWWQYGVARSGNGLSWVYTVEWPFFAVYATYIWWKLIHDQSTPFDRLWAAKQRAAADASGTPIHQIPGWALDKELSRAVHDASFEAARHPALADSRAEALDARHRERDMLESPEQKGVRAARESLDHDGPQADDRDPPTGRDDELPVIDARVLEVRADVDEELEAYNRYLFELSRTGSPNRWRSSRGHTRPGASPESGEARSPTPEPKEGGRAQLPSGGGKGKRR